MCPTINANITYCMFIRSKTKFTHIFYIINFQKYKKEKISTICSILKKKICTELI